MLIKAITKLVVLNYVNQPHMISKWVTSRSQSTQGHQTSDKALDSHQAVLACHDTFSQLACQDIMTIILDGVRHQHEAAGPRWSNWVDRY